MKKANLLFCLGIIYFFNVVWVFAIEDTSKWSFARKAAGQNYSDNIISTYIRPSEYILETTASINVAINGVYTGVYNYKDDKGKVIHFASLECDDVVSSEITVSYSATIKAFEVYTGEELVSVQKKSAKVIGFKSPARDRELIIELIGNTRSDILHLFINSKGKGFPQVESPQGYTYDESSGLCIFGPGYYDLSKMSINAELRKAKSIYIMGGALVDEWIGFDGSLDDRVYGRGLFMGNKSLGMKRVSPVNSKIQLNDDIWEFAIKAIGERTTDENLITYSRPLEYPMEGPAQFTVSVNGKYTGIYNDNNCFGGSVNFGYFDFKENVPVTIDISYAGTLDDFDLIPDRYGVRAYRKDDRTITFTLNEADVNLTLIVNDDYRGDVLHLFANSIDEEVPESVRGKSGYIYEPTSELHYFGPGYYDLSEFFSEGKLTLDKDYRAYLAGGAVLDGQLCISSGTSARIFGRGMVMNQEHNKGMVMQVLWSSGATVEGIIVHGHRAKSWTTGVDNSSDIHFKNVKIISTRYASTDGCDINLSTGCTFENMFIRACDDAIAIKGMAPSTTLPSNYKPNRNLTFERIQLWNDANNAFGLGAETQASIYENISLKSSDILFSYDDPNHHEQLDERSAMNICALHGTYFRNILFEDIRVYRCERLIGLGFKNDFWFGSIQGNQKLPGGIEEITFRNITLMSNSGSEIANDIWLYGWYEDGTPMKEVKNIVFDNVIIEGNLLTGDDDIHIKTNNTDDHELVKNLIFKNSVSDMNLFVNDNRQVSMYPIATDAGRNIYVIGISSPCWQAYNVNGYLCKEGVGNMIPVNGWDPGAYLVKIYDTDNNIIKVGKIIIR